MTRITRATDGRFAVTLDDDEFIALTQLEADLLAVLAERLRSVADGAVAPSALFPDAYRDDPEAAAEFHALTDVDLVTAKSDAARVIMTSFAAAEPELSSGLWRRAETRTVVFDADQAHGMMRNLSDLRLLLAERLGIQRDDDRGHPGREHASSRTAYVWLAITQERLVAALAASYDATDR